MKMLSRLCTIAGLVGLALALSSIYRNAKSVLAHVAREYSLTAVADQRSEVVGFESALRFGSTVRFESQPHEPLPVGGLHLIYLSALKCSSCAQTTKAVAELVKSNRALFSGVQIICTGECEDSVEKFALDAAGTGLDVKIREVVDRDQFRLRTGLRGLPSVVILDQRSEIRMFAEGKINASTASSLDDFLKTYFSSRRPVYYNGNGIITF